MEIMEGQDSDWDTFWFIWMQTYIYYGVVSIECDFSSVSVVLWNFSSFCYFLYLTNSNPCNRFKFSDNLLIAMI